jgi:hypothetical protein
LSKTDENVIAMWEIKVLRRILGPVKENNMWKICTNQGLMNLYRKPDIISEIRKGKLRWLEHVEQMSKERTVKKVFRNMLEGKRSVGKPRKTWYDDENV